MKDSIFHSHFITLINSVSSHFTPIVYVLSYYSQKDGTSLPNGRSEIKNGNLSIYNLQEEDRGLYVCSVTNKASTITAETELLVETIPSSAPYNLTGISSAHNVYLKWWAGRQRVNVNYSIWYKPVESKEWKTYDVPQSSYLDATIDNLDPGKIRLKGFFGNNFSHNHQHIFL